MDPYAILLYLILLPISFSTAYSPAPMNCTDTTRLCTSFLAFKPEANETLSVIQSMFDVLPEDVTVEGGDGRGYVFIKKNCSCADGIKKYLTNTTFTVKSGDGYVYDMVMEAYGGLTFLPNTTRRARYGAVVSLRLLCGCSSGLWNYLMSYVMRDGDSIESLASRFGVSMDSIEKVNGIDDPDNVTVGAVYYIPLNSVPGEPYPLESIPLAPVPSPPLTVLQQIKWIIRRMCHIYGLSSKCLTEERRGHSKDPDGQIRFHILGKPSFCCGSGRYMCCTSADWKQTNGDSNNQQITIPKALGSHVLDMEKPVVFTYEEISSSTDGFSDSRLLGHGTYGSVYYGLLREQEVAIKRMTATKTKEFLAEIKVLCKVHHTNLVELIGYAASDDELFLIYEYAQKGSLKSHLHDPQNKGHTSLSWIMRVQIALDAARGLEYIHEHTKTHYVHRDIKTSNILLDGTFRAKISDFGLAKFLVKQVREKLRYLSDGRATTKSDIYAFGVVLFELISGKEAVIRTEGTATKNSERRSLMHTALRSAPDSMSMSSLKDYIDPNMMDLYPHDCLFKVAMIAKQCVDDDPILRPDMKGIVISLSQILLSSVEWEATLAGNSQFNSDPILRGSSFINLYSILRNTLRQ
ncbi:protein kinase family protein / peptidoglycan-binding LysM domain-containing protein [Prunus dulcis]|uniref:Protein kinase family protein / peptidoglycan-binding LysM domain-containing protein n=1 Tax=Prunus dulcis TaxID=3755 RepID=A0A4Y1R4E6_PRUDU|nr:protein kinase family protein / peptidoglycan-binding LysM domain-containing protein [Prunus dulcis]